MSGVPSISGSSQCMCRLFYDSITHLQSKQIMDFNRLIEELRNRIPVFGCLEVQVVKMLMNDDE